MIKLLTAFWNIMLKRSDQENLPDSNFFLGAVFFFYFLTQLPSGLTISVSVESFLRSFVIDAVLLGLWLKLLVEAFSSQEYFRRSLTALFGTGAIFNIIASPLIILFSSYLQAENLSDFENGGFPIILTMAFLFIAIWSLVIMAHIFSKVMRKPNYSMLVAFSYLIVNFFIQSLASGL